MTAIVQNDVAQGPTGVRARPTMPAHYFFVVAAITMLTTMVAGFYPYYLRGEGMAGRTISPELATLVFVHGAAMTIWLTLFLVQSLLVPGMSDKDERMVSRRVASARSQLSRVALAHDERGSSVRRVRSHPRS